MAPTMNVESMSRHKYMEVFLSWLDVGFIKFSDKKYLWVTNINLSTK